MADKGTQHETRIKIAGDANSAVGAFASVQKALLGVRKAISDAMNALGVFWMAWNGVTTVISGIKALHGWLERTANAAGRAAFSRQYDAAAASAADGPY